MATAATNDLWRRELADSDVMVITTMQMSLIARWRRRTSGRHLTQHARLTSRHRAADQSLGKARSRPPGATWELSLIASDPMECLRRLILPQCPDPK